MVVKVYRHSAKCVHEVGPGIKDSVDGRPTHLRSAAYDTTFAATFRDDLQESALRSIFLSRRVERLGGRSGHVYESPLASGPTRRATSRITTLTWQEVRAGDGAFRRWIAMVIRKR